MLAESVAVTLLVVEALEELGVAYAIGGSLASSVHGQIRATQDADLVADLGPGQAAALVRKLGQRFYADRETIETAIQGRSSFNLLHLDTMFKVDVFVAKSRPFDQAQLARRQLQPVSQEPERLAYVTSAEDVILAKLEWYRMGGEVSERQWRDVRGVLTVQGDRLDLAYLHRMAAGLGVAALLERALAEMGLV